MSNSGSFRKSSDTNLKRSSDIYEFSSGLRRYSSQNTSSPSIKQRPSSLSSFTSASTLVAKQSSSSVAPQLATITPQCSPQPSPVTTPHHSTSSPVEYPVNTLPFDDVDNAQESSLAEDAVNATAGRHDDIPMQTLSGDQTKKLPHTDPANDKFAETEFTAEDKKKSAPILFGSRSETGPFEIEVTKGFWGLGVTVDCDKTGAIFVKALTSRGLLNKDGNIKLVPKSTGFGYNNLLTQ